MNKIIDRILLLKPNIVIGGGVAVLWTVLYILYLFDIPADFSIRQNSTEVNPTESQRLFMDYGKDSILDSIYPIPNSSITKLSFVDDRKYSAPSHINNCLSGHEADVWYLGRNGIKWINDTPTVLIGFADDAGEVMSSICDKNGDLLLYSDGDFIYNKFHERLASIYLKGGGSSSMFLMLPQPGNDSIYYVFHPQQDNGGIYDTLFNLYYTIINVNANLQHGKVVSLNKLLMKTSSEKITGIRHCNGRDWWVLGLRSTDEAFHSWVLSDTGLTVNSPIISYSGKVNHLLTYDQENIGWLKPSHDGRLLLEITTGGQLYSTAELHRFDNFTGKVYDGINLIEQEDKYNDLYSAEFSPNNSIIYFTGHRLRNGFDLYQMEVSNYDSTLIRKSIIEIAATQSNIGSPILGKDGKIYITNWGSKADYLHVINKPNFIGSSCDFNYFAFPLGSNSSLGAPLFASGFQFPYKVYIQGPTTFCQDTTVRYIITDPCPHPAAQWSILGGGSIVRQSGDTLEVYYAGAGQYRIAASYPTDCGMKTDTVKVEVKECIKPKPDYCLSGNEADIWYLGRNGIKWINDTPTVLTGFADDAGEVMSSICDKNGDLLLYSDGNYIYNKFHERLALIFQKGGGSSSMFLILPQPGNDSIYYVFHPQQVSQIINDTIYNLYYTVINVKANGYHGKIVKLSQLLMKTSSEKITGIKHCNGRDWWVLGLRATDEAFHSWVLSDTGLTINNPIISYSGIVHHLESNKQQNRGWLKSSHNGSILIEITLGSQFYSTLELHKFNHFTGEVISGVEILYESDKYESLYSAEFSPDNSKVYITGYQGSTGYDLFQIDVSIFDFNWIRNSLKYIAATQSNLGSPILGKDGKIYITNSGFMSGFIHFINKPNLSGAACEFNYFAFNLGSKTWIGAPLFASGFQFPYKVYVQGPTTFCQDTTVRYINTDPCPHPTAQWSILGGGSVVRQSGDTLEVYYAEAGQYRIAASYPTECGMKTDTVKVEVQRCNCLTQLSWSVIDTLICQGADAQFKFITNSTEVFIDNHRITTDSFAINNLQSDTCFNITLSYPRFCDSLISICVKVAPKNNTTHEYTLCPNDSIWIDNIWLKQDTSYQLKYLSHLSCDSIVDIRIHQNGVDTSKLELEYCYGDTALIFNTVIFSDTSLQALYQSTSGCFDSLKIVEVMFSNKAKVYTIPIERCYADSAFILNKWYTGDTIIFDTLTSHKSCDSIIIYDINIKSPILTTDINYKLCHDDTLNISTSTGVVSISESLDIEDHWTTASGCDSLIIHHIEVLPTYTSSLILKKCTNDSIFYKNKYYLKPIIFTESFTSVNGCDSIKTIEISDYQEAMTSTETWNVCYGDSVMLNGNWLYSDTSLSTLYQNIYGCDSVHQVILKYFPKVAENTFEFNICKGDSIFLNGLYYKDSTLIKSYLKNGNGCDSIVNIRIAVFSESIRSSEQHFICPGDSILIDNQYYYDSIQLVKRMQDRNGCDSVHSISILLLTGPQPRSEVLHFCKGDSIYLNSQWYKVPANIMVRKTSSGFCDSIFTYTLVEYPKINIDLIPELTIEKGMTVVLDPGSISGDLKYHWHPSADLSCNDCRNPVLSANTSITYYIEIIDSHGCITLDSIVINVIDQKEDQIFFPSIFSPNGDNTNDVWQPIPSNQDIKLMRLDIFDRWGQRVYHWTHDVSHSSIPAWNGTVNGREMLPSVYVFQLFWADRKGEHQKVGEFTLLR